MRALAALCGTNGIRLDVIATPLCYKTFYSRDFNAIARFRESLASILPFWDFSGFTELHTSPRYWHDASHFTTDVGLMMLETVAGGKPVRDGFGVRITPENSHAFYRDLYSEAIGALPGLMARDRMVSPHDCFLGAAQPVPGNAIAADRRSVAVDAGRAASRCGDAALLSVECFCSEKGILEVRRIGERNEPFESRPVRRGRNRIFIPLAAGCAGVELKAGRPLIFPATVSARACSLAPAQQLTDSPPSAGSAHLRGQPLIIDIGLDDKN